MTTQEQNHPPLTELQTLALGRIRFFERELEKYGMRVRCGMELEFFPTTQEGELTQGVLNVEQALAYLRNEHHMPEIERVYHEGSQSYNPAAWNKSVEYEVTVGAKPVAGVSSTEIVASRIHALKSHALRAMLNSTTCLNTPEILNNTTLMAAFSPFRERAGEMFQRPAPETAGLHVSVSMENEQGINVFSLSPAFMVNCAERLKEVQQAGLLAMMPDGETSLQRLKQGSSVPKGFGVQWKRPVTATNPYAFYNSVFLRYQGDMEDFRGDIDSLIAQSKFGHKETAALAEIDEMQRNLKRAMERDGGASLRIENRLPGADADPYVCAALTLAALYQAVKRTVKIRPENTEGMELLNAERGLYVQPSPEARMAQAIPTNASYVTDSFRRCPWLPALLSPEFYSRIVQDYGGQGR